MDTQRLLVGIDEDEQQQSEFGEGRRGGWASSLFGSTPLSKRLKWDDPWQEASGALGDLGTFLPLTLAMAVVAGLDMGVTLLFTGAYSIITGLAFGIPMPVQPMKSIVAVALVDADPLTIPQVMAAGMVTSVVLIILGVTGLVNELTWLVPRSVIRGIQLGLGLSLAAKGAGMLMYEKAGGPLRPWLGSDSLGLGLAAALFVLAFSPRDTSKSSEGSCGSSGESGDASHSIPAHSQPPATPLAHSEDGHGRRGPRTRERQSGEERGGVGERDSLGGGDRGGWKRGRGGWPLRVK